MELPFAVDSPDRAISSRSLHSTSSSLVTASSQGSGNTGTSSAIKSNNNNNTNLPTDNDNNADLPITTSPKETDTEEIDFTYVTVCELDADEVDVVINGAVNTAGRDNYSTAREIDDVLTVLMREGTTTTTVTASVGGPHYNKNNRIIGNEEFVQKCEEANAAAMEAIVAKEKGNLQAALNAHSKAAREFRNAAIAIRCRGDTKTSSIANSLLLSCKSQARSALALKRVIKRPVAVVDHCHRKQGDDGPMINGSNNEGGTAMSATTHHQTHKDRLRETVRGALVTRNEADISDSAFLGRGGSISTPKGERHGEKDSVINPVDDVMELEKELRDMDMALELGNSIASIATLGGRTQNARAKQFSLEEGSFCVVPPGMDPWSSFVAQPHHHRQQHQQHHPPSRPPIQTPPGMGTANVRARANRVQNILEASSQTSRSIQQHHHQKQQSAPSQKHPPNGLESSWWGNGSLASHVAPPMSLEASHISVEPHGGGGGGGQQPTNTKQVMRLLDSLRTLGDENAALLRELEDADKARSEARAAREQMKRFKSDYDKRFKALKSALEKFRKQNHPEKAHANNTENNNNPVSGSNYMRLESASEEIQKKDQFIRRLTTELKKEREDSKKKDAALRKYEDFYRQVKKRSAQKAAQKQQEMQQQQKQQLQKQRQQQQQQSQNRSKLPPSRPPP